MKSSVVLMYHDIVTDDDKSSGFQNESAFQYKVEKAAFEEQVKALQGKDVVFTFDDGGESFYTVAAPILEKYAFKGVFFISTNYIGTPGFLTREQVIALAARGHIIGSHSHTHPHNFTILTREEMRKEWQESFDILKDLLGSNQISVSIPNGYSSKMVLKEAVQCGYTEIYTSQPTTKIKLFQKHNVIGRYVVHDNITTHDILNIATSKGCRMKLALKWHLLNLVKMVLGGAYDRVKAIIIR